MLVLPSLERVVYGPRGMLVGIDACVEAQCVMSAVTLIYATIDAVSALVRPVRTVESTSEQFREWVRRYYLPALRAPVSVEDIWGARCGVVHTYGPDSRSSRGKGASILVYKWRTGHRPDDEVLTERSADGRILDVEQMVEALHIALARFQEEVASSPELLERVEHHVKELLCYEPWPSEEGDTER